MARPESFSIILLGETGTGKSQLGNALSGMNKFEVDDDAKSCTSKVKLCQFEFEAETVRVYDTPGLNDGNGKDSAHLKELHKQLKTVKDCAGFLLVVMEGQKRVPKSTKGMLEYFYSTFGAKFAEKLTVVVTKSGRKEDRNPYKLRRFRDTKTTEINELLGFKGDLPFFFVDTGDEYDPIPREEIKHDMEGILRNLSVNDRVSLGDMKVVSTKEDQAKRALDAKQKEVDKKEEEVQEKEKQAKEAHELQEKSKQELEQAKKQRQALKKQMEENKTEKDEAIREMRRLERGIRQHQEAIAAEKSKAKDKELDEMRLQLNEIRDEVKDLRSRGNRRTESSGIDLSNLLSLSKPQSAGPEYGSGRGMGGSPERNGGAPSSVDDFTSPSRDPIERASCRTKPRSPKVSSSPDGERFYKGGQFTPGGGRAPKGGIYLPSNGGGFSSRPSVAACRPPPSCGSGGGTFYKGGQFMPGGGRAPKGGAYG